MISSIGNYLEECFFLLISPHTCIVFVHNPQSRIYKFSQRYPTGVGGGHLGKKYSELRRWNRYVTFAKVCFSSAPDKTE